MQRMRKCIRNRRKEQALMNIEEHLKDCDADCWKKKISHHEELIKGII